MVIHHLWIIYIRISSRTRQLSMQETPITHQSSSILQLRFPNSMNLIAWHWWGSNRRHQVGEYMVISTSKMLTERRTYQSRESWQHSIQAWRGNPSMNPSCNHLIKKPLVVPTTIIAFIDSAKTGRNSRKYLTRRKFKETAMNKF